MTTRTVTPAESWHEVGTHRVRVTLKRGRYFASVFGSADWRCTSAVGRTVWGDYPTPAEAVRAAETFISCTREDTGERVCNWRDVEKVRAELAKGRQ